MQIMAPDGMLQNLLGLIKAYCSSTKMKVWASGSDTLPFEFRSAVQQGCALSPTLFNYILDWILGQALQHYPRFQVGANGNAPDLANSNGIVILSSSYSEMQGLFEAVNCHATAIGMSTTASKTKVTSALILGEQRQAVLLDGEPLEDVDKFK